MFYATWWSLFPPVIAIALAFILKDVYLSLFLGVVTAGLLASGFHPWAALEMIVSTMNGTLRAIGASQRFIALQFLSETALLTVSAGILGCILGGAASILINRADIQLGNSLLVQLFGGNRINAVLTLTNILRCLAISVALAFLGWLYPVHVAMESNPIVAMRGQV